jgi:CHAD domain-containing protein
MEIEAKFAVPNRAVYRQLARLKTLAGYALRPAGVGQVADRYFDTADGRLRAGGFACRLRTEGDTIVATLKGLGGAQGAVHRRAEEEARLAQWTPDPAAWPESAARTLALELAAEAPLAPLFDLTQRRARADLYDSERRVAQLSLDYVRTDLTGLRRPARAVYYELEVELAADGREADLTAVVAELAGVWELRPEPRSKYERALELLQERRAALDLGLTPEERQTLEVQAASADKPPGHRALAVLGWDEGLPVNEIAGRCGLSAGRVRYWVRAFRIRRLGIFESKAPQAAPGPVNAPPSVQPVPAPAAAPPAAAADRGPSSAMGTVRTVKQLCTAHGVDMAHARCVAGQARLLFDALKPIHKLPKKRRQLLRNAALLNTVGAASSPERPQQAGRDVILAAPLHDITTVERLALSCIVAFGSGKARADREPAMAALDPKMRQQVLALAALVRLAEALDTSRTQRTAIESFTGVDRQRCEITLAGPSAAMDATQANRAADLWYQQFKQELVFVARPEVGASLGAPTEAGLSQAGELAAQETPPATAEPAMPPAPPPLAADDPMSEAGRKVLALHFSRMLANEAGTRLGVDPEALHDMRVATRRMRAAFALFAPYYEEAAIAPFIKGLRRAGRTLGAVRDLDVLLDKARAYAASLPADGPGSLTLLLEAWGADRDRARREMLTYLDGPAYRQLAAEFGAFLATPGAGALTFEADTAAPFQVRHVIPRLILTRYGSVRAYERLLPGGPPTTYHALRIECKGLRYALEFFREVLGEETSALIKQVTAMQDLLGELQDACVAEGLLADFLKEQHKQLRKRGADDALIGIEAYLTAQHTRQAELIASFPPAWAGLIGPEFRRNLALAIATI